MISEEIYVLWQIRKQLYYCSRLRKKIMEDLPKLFLIIVHDSFLQKKKIIKKSPNHYCKSAWVSGFIQGYMQILFMQLKSLWLLLIQIRMEGSGISLRGVNVFC